MNKEAILVEIKELQMEKEALSYKRFWTGSDYLRNRELTDKIYLYERILKNDVK